MIAGHRIADRHEDKQEVLEAETVKSEKRKCCTSHDELRRKIHTPVYPMNHIFMTFCDAEGANFVLKTKEF